MAPCSATLLLIEVPYGGTAIEYVIRKEGYVAKVASIVPNVPSPFFAVLEARARRPRCCLWWPFFLVRSVNLNADALTDRDLAKGGPETRPLQDRCLRGRAQGRRRWCHGPVGPLTPKPTNRCRVEDPSTAEAGSRFGDSRLPTPVLEQATRLHDQATRFHEQATQLTTKRRDLFLTRLAAARHRGNPRVPARVSLTGAPRRPTLTSSSGLGPPDARPPLSGSEGSR